MAESADATDLKSVDGDIVWVRPPLALLKRPQKGVFFLRLFSEFSPQTDWDKNSRII